MRIELYEHNERAYENALLLLQSDKKAAVIHPTGTGKSFIAFKLCEDNSDKKICWLSPSEYIFDTQLENLKKVTGGYAPQNISFFTYAKLMNMSETEISDIKLDFIILDEFHRCGAEMWGQGVERLLSAYPDTQILGLSATAIRYLDNQRNMADELFDGNIASEISLGEAIVRGILAPPKYVLSAFSCQKDLEKYQRRVKHAKSKAVRDEGEKYLDALKRALNKADGLDEIFNKHMCERTGKYIVFCSDYEHMCHMKELAAEWFYKIDKSPHIYSLYSEEPSSDKEFDAFKADRDDTHLRLLYCIDALNEGVHVDGISGVILLRLTVSPIIYKQQIGRTLQSGIKSSSVIFDIVLNIENIYSIGTIEEEMRLAVSYYRALGQDYNIVNEHFEVTDEVKDCIPLSEKLNETLTASWDFMYAEAKRYYEENGNLEIPKRYKTESGYLLGSRLTTQRRVYSGAASGVLTKERIEKLNKIGIVWESARDASWNRYYEAARGYSSEFGNINVPALYVTDDGVRLGKWISNLRTAKRNGFNSRFLTAERIKALDALGMEWESADYMWQRYFGACLSYYSANKNLNVPHDYITADGVKLGLWINNIRAARRNENRGGNYLTDERIRALDELEMNWEGRKADAWNRGYSAAEEYYKSHGDLRVSATYKAPDVYMLGRWIDRQRRNEKLSADRREKLDRLGMVWKKEDSWDVRYRLAAEYYRKNGNLDIKTNYVADGIWLGKWIAEQRKNYRDGTLPRDCARWFEDIGVAWKNGKRTDSGNSIEKIIAYGPIAINGREYCFEDGM